MQSVLNRNDSSMTYVSDAGFMWPTHVPSPREKNTLPTVGTPIRAWLSGGLQLLEGAHGDVTGEAVKHSGIKMGKSSLQPMLSYP